MRGSAGLPGYQPPAQPPLPFISSSLTASLFHYFIISTAPRFPPCPVSHLDSCIVRFALFSGCRFNKAISRPLFPGAARRSFGVVVRVLQEMEEEAAKLHGPQRCRKEGIHSSRRQLFPLEPNGRHSSVRLPGLPNPSSTLHPASLSATRNHLVAHSLVNRSWCVPERHGRGFALTCVSCEHVGERHAILQRDGRRTNNVRPSGTYRNWTCHIFNVTDGYYVDDLSLQETCRILHGRYRLYPLFITTTAPSSANVFPQASSTANRESLVP